MDGKLVQKGCLLKHENINTGNRHEHSLFFVRSVLQKTDIGPCGHCALMIGSLNYHNDDDKKNVSTNLMHLYLSITHTHTIIIIIIMCKC
jgi:hypothetical protein